MSSRQLAAGAIPALTTEEIEEIKTAGGKDYKVCFYHIACASITDGGRSKAGLHEAHGAHVRKLVRLTAWPAIYRKPCDLCKLISKIVQNHPQDARKCGGAAAWLTQTSARHLPIPDMSVKEKSARHEVLVSKGLAV